MKFLKKRGVLPAVVVTAAVAASVVVVHFSGSNPVTNAVRSVFSPFQHGAAYITAKINSLTNFIWEADSYKEQNEALRQELNQAQADNMDAAKYREENERLQALLNLKGDMEDYDTIAAKVIAYSANNWYDTIEINKGKKDGIEVGDCVLSSDGVVGRVVSVGTNWSNVSSIINTGSATGIRVSRTGDIGVVEGDGELCMQGLCSVSFIENNSGLIVGDILETSGSSGIYPEGCLVGRITDVRTDNTGSLISATVEPIVDFSGLREVLVVK